MSTTETAAPLPPAPAVTPEGHPRALDMVWIPRATYWMGSDDAYPEERPAHQVTVDGFWIDRHPVTNREFARFIAKTGYVTFAERAPDASRYPDADPAMLVPGSAVFKRPDRPVPLTDAYAWWEWKPGACWSAPRGRGSSIEGLEDHPVVHVAHEDAETYARWAGVGLPTEAEWELAARGGLDRKPYAWGDEFRPGGRSMANVWQGRFPMENLAEDGWEWTSPVGAYPSNGFGLHDMIGNVWEWTCDWYRAGHVARNCCGGINPRGPREEESHDPAAAGPLIGRKVIKGGSFLCAASYCQRYRPAARLAQPIDTTTCHVGFRCALRV